VACRPRVLHPVHLKPLRLPPSHDAAISNEQNKLDEARQTRITLEASVELHVDIRGVKLWVEHSKQDHQSQQETGENSPRASPHLRTWFPAERHHHLMATMHMQALLHQGVAR
jgi:hypothetical protein